MGRKLDLVRPRVSVTDMDYTDVPEEKSNQCNPCNLWPYPFPLDSSRYPNYG